MRRETLMLRAGSGIAPDALGGDSIKPLFSTSSQRRCAILPMQ